MTTTKMNNDHIKLLHAASAINVALESISKEDLHQLIETMSSDGIEKQIIIQDIHRTYAVYNVSEEEFQNKCVKFLLERVNSEGIWIGAVKNSENRPSPYKFKPAGVAHSNRLDIIPATIVMRSSGKHPHAIGLELSHLCNRSYCMKAEHLCWEPRSNNMLRNRCWNAKQCLCGDTKPCYFGEHATLSDVESKKRKDR